MITHPHPQRGFSSRRTAADKPDAASRVASGNPSTEQPTPAAKVTTPDANTHGQTGTADQRARSLVPASAKAVAKTVGQSGQEAGVELPVGALTRAVA